MAFSFDWMLLSVLVVGVVGAGGSCLLSSKSHSLNLLLEAPTKDCQISLFSLHSLCEIKVCVFQTEGSGPLAHA